MEIRSLRAHTRQIESGPTPKALRRSGLMPAVVYGQGKTPLMLSIDMNEFKNLLNHITSQSLISLDVEGDTTASKTVMIKELQRHPVSRKFIHADFYEVDMKKKIHVHVPISTVGETEGVAKGGTLEIIRRTLEVICLPGDIPESITVNISGLGIGDAIHISQVITEGDVKLAWDKNIESDYAVVTVAAPTIEKTPEVEAAEAAAAEGEEGGEGKEGEEKEGKAGKEGKEGKVGKEAE